MFSTLAALAPKENLTTKSKDASTSDRPTAAADIVGSKSFSGSGGILKDGKSKDKYIVTKPITVDSTDILKKLPVLSGVRRISEGNQKEDKSMNANGVNQKVDMNGVIFKLSSLLSFTKLTGGKEYAQSEYNQAKTKMVVNDESDDDSKFPLVKCYLDKSEENYQTLKRRYDDLKIGYSADDENENDTFISIYSDNDVEKNIDISSSYSEDSENEQYEMDSENDELGIDVIVKNDAVALKFNPIMYQYWENNVKWSNDTDNDTDGETRETSKKITPNFKSKEIVEHDKSVHISREDQKIANGEDNNTENDTQKENPKEKELDEDRMNKEDSDADDDDIEWEITRSSSNMSMAPKLKCQISLPETRTCPPGTNVWSMLKSNDISKSMSMGRTRSERSGIVISNGKDLPTLLNSKLAQCSFLKNVIWDDLEPIRMTNDAHMLIQDENDIELVVRDVENEKDTRIRVTGPKVVIEESEEEEEIIDEDVRVDPDTGKKLRKSKKEKARDMEKRLERLAHLNFLSQEDLTRVKGNVEEEGELRASYVWETTLPKLDPVRVQPIKANLKPYEARNFHRPRSRYVENDEVPILVARANRKGLGQSKGSMNASGWRKMDLTAREGDLIFLEYAEQYPPILLRTGMPSTLVNFYCRDFINEDEKAKFIPPQMSRGTTVLLDPKDASPFLGNMHMERMYTTIYNQLFMATISEHQVNQNDFLLVRPKKPMRDSRANASTRGTGLDRQTLNERPAYIRELDGFPIYVVGQIMPRLEVFHPGKIEMKNFLKDLFMPYHFIRRLNKSVDRSGGLTMGNFRDIFPTHNEATIRNAIQPIAAPHGTSKHYRLRKDAPDIGKDMLPPQLLCRYESCLAGMQRLEDRSINLSAKNDVLRTMQGLKLLEQFHIFKSEASRAMEYAATMDKKKLRGKLSEDSIKRLRAARWLVEELQITPWFQSSCYVNMQIRKGQPNNKFSSYRMRVEGFGDPSGRGEAFSYLPDDREPIEAFLKKRKKKYKKRGGRNRRSRYSDDEMDTIAKTGYGGTDKDLRSITLSTGMDVLRKYFKTFHEHKFKLLKRWDVITLVKVLVQLGYINDKDLSKYNRNLPKPSDAIEEENRRYQEKLDKRFDEQQLALSSTTAPKLLRLDSEKALNKTIEMDSSDDDEDDLLGLENSTTANSTTSTMIVVSKAKKNVVQDNSDDSDSDDLDGLADLMKNKDTTVAKAAEEPAKPRIIRRNPNHAPAKILKRTIVEMQPNGKLRVRVVFVKSKAEINKYRSRKMAREPNRLKAKNADAEAEKKLKKKREKEQQLMEEGRKRFQWYKENIQKHGKDWPMTQGGPEVKTRCRRCRLPGHTQISRKCPLFYSRHEAVKVSKNPLKFSINRKKLPSSAANSPPKKSKRELLKEQRQKEREEKRKKKRRSDSFDDGIYSKPTKRSERGARSRGPTYELNMKLKEIWKRLSSGKDAGFFHQKVSRSVRGYYDIIKNPIDLGKIKKQIENMKYKSATSFVDDLRLMLDNAIEFNGANHEIALSAERLLNTAKEAVAVEQEEYDKLAEEIEATRAPHRRQLGKKSKTKGASQQAKKKARGRTESVVSQISGPSAGAQSPNAIAPMAVDVDVSNFTLGFMDDMDTAPALEMENAMVDETEAQNAVASFFDMSGGEEEFQGTTADATDAATKQSTDETTQQELEAHADDDLEGLDLEGLEEGGEVVEEEEEEEFILE